MFSVIAVCKAAMPGAVGLAASSENRSGDAPAKAANGNKSDAIRQVKPLVEHAFKGNEWGREAIGMAQAKTVENREYSGISVSNRDD